MIIITINGAFSMDSNIALVLLSLKDLERHLTPFLVSIYVEINLLN